MIKYNLSELDWKLAGFVPEYWRRKNCTETGAGSEAEIPAVKANVPGSVQKALLDAGIIPDWNVGLNARQCEWVENRHWIYETHLPDEWFRKGDSFKLKCLGLDYCGCIRFNGKEVLRFANSHIPHIANLTPHLNKNDNILQIIFECPPRWLGQFGFTSKFMQWKPRFNYFWDWTIRMVQTGIWDDIVLEIDPEKDIDALKIAANANINTNKGSLNIKGMVPSPDNLRVEANLYDGNISVEKINIPAETFNSNGILWDNLDISLWWPNRMGIQKLYKLVISLKNSREELLAVHEKNIGFRNIKWEKCKNAPANASPWLCIVNGIPMFLFGVNWTPIRTNFADVTPADYHIRLKAYKNMNMNLVRVWGGAFLEKEIFYDICDQLGILVWQEFPLSSSGIENYPPDDPAAIEELSQIAVSFVQRRHHHPSLLMWSGGNELADDKNGRKTSWYTPITEEHPLIKRFVEIVRLNDENRRFIPSSPSGPRGHGTVTDFGKGVHWDVHGPWKIWNSIEEYEQCWKQDDALFRSEVGAPGPASATLIRKYKGGCEELPVNIANPFWNRSPWWIESAEFIKEKKQEPQNLEEYVEWGQKRQAYALSLIVKTEFKRFPECGGVLIWMGHDCYPCNANTSILDFDGNPKLVASELSELSQMFIF